MKRTPMVLAAPSIMLGTLLGVSNADFHAKDPGIRGGEPGAGGAVPGLTLAEGNLWQRGLDEFSEEDGVGEGLGPRFNLDSCGGCHSQPAVGGTSPAVNPQMRMVDEDKFPKNTLPFFITEKGPTREARIVKDAQGKPDGGVAALFTITGHLPGCELAQPDFVAEGLKNNLIFRIPTPVFGAGLIEAIPDHVILENQAASSERKELMGIGGRPGRTVTITGGTNRTGNDGTITRFGWKAQNKSLETFAGEAYNVEMGISNEVFPTERDETPECQNPNVPVPNDSLKVTDTEIELSNVTLFVFFMRALAAPVPVAEFPGASADSITSGRQVFADIGCGLCHTPTLKTDKNAAIVEMRDKEVHLFSDLLLHNMGRGLADGVMQGVADGNEFRTAPLWGLGQRIFLLHDGRTDDLVVAIQEHQSPGSEANKVIKLFEKLSEGEKQALLNFLRSL